MTQDNIDAQFTGPGCILTTTSSATPGIIATGAQGDVLTVDTGDSLKAVNTLINTSASYTPSVVGSGTPGTAVYVLQKGFYSTAGNMVFVWGTLNFNTFTGIGDMQITMPLTAGASTSTAGAGTSIFNGTFDSGNNVIMTVSAGNAYGTLVVYGSAVSSAVQSCVGAALITFFIYYTLD